MGYTRAYILVGDAISSTTEMPKHPRYFYFTFNAAPSHKRVERVSRPVMRR